MPKEDFASMLEASMKSGKGPSKRLRNGEAVEGRIIQISSDSVFVDVGSVHDARVPRGELEDREGQLKVKVGDTLRATVIDADADTPLLAVVLGKGGLDLGQLRTARETGAPVSAKVTRVIKGGLEVDIGGVRAFCPASQVELGFVQDLGPYEGQTFEMRVLEIKDDGRSVVVSRRALLEEQRRAREAELKDSLVPGTDLDGSVSSVTRHGAIVDVGGVEGFVHISELAHRRIDRAEDVVNVGDRVQVRVLGVEQGDKGLRIRLSMKARSDAPEVETPTVDEVLDAVVVKSTQGGIIVSTSKGEGLVPARELGLAPGADHRRAFPIGRELKVVVLGRDAARGRVRFSAVGVADVEERLNYREFGGRGATPGAALGSLGDVLRKKLGLPEGEPAAAEPPVDTAKRQAEPPVDTAKRQAEPPPGVHRRKR